MAENANFFFLVQAAKYALCIGVLARYIADVKGNKDGACWISNMPD